MVESGMKQEQGELFLPPGFRFHPTDEEVVTSYVLQKSLNPSFAPRAIGEVNLNKCEPWDLPSKTKMGEEWYFFCQKDMRYSTGRRTNRATEKGYWKATGRDREIFTPASSASVADRRELVGMKKTLVFYLGRAPRGSKTNWVMHEFRLEGKYRDDANLHLSPRDEWVVCKVFHKNNGEDKKKAAAVESSAEMPPNISSVSVEATDDMDGFINSLLDPMYFNSTSSLPDFSTTMDAAAAVAPYDDAVDYSIVCTAAAATTTTSSFVALPNYDTFSSAAATATDIGQAVKNLGA